MKKMALFVGMMICCTAFHLAGAELTLYRFYSDNMVLQRSKPIVVRGAAAGKTVNVSFNTQSKTTTADAAGLWSVTLAPMTASAQSATLKVSSGETVITKENILVGDLILVPVNLVSISLLVETMRVETWQKHISVMIRFAPQLAMGNALYECL